MHETNDLIQLIPALLLDGVGIALLYLSWQQVLTRRTLAVWSGWGLLSLSVVFWNKALGAEFGVTLALLVPALLAWICVLLGADFGPPDASKQRSRAARASDTGEAIPANPAAPTRWARHLLLLVQSVPVAGLCAALISLAFVDLLPGSKLNRLVLAVFLMPTLWSLAAYWLCAVELRGKPLVWLGGSALLSALWLFAL